jgi:anaerobic C4-dicarboxylate transporter
VDQLTSGGSVEPRQLPLVSAGARWLIAAAVLGSGIALLDGTVVNVALPSIGRELGADLTGQQWVLDGYLLTLSALLLSGGAVMAAAGSFLPGWPISPELLWPAGFRRPLAG